MTVAAERARITAEVEELLEKGPLDSVALNPDGWQKSRRRTIAGVPIVWDESLSVYGWRPLLPPAEPAPPQFGADDRGVPVVVDAAEILARQGEHQVHLPDPEPVLPEPEWAGVGAARIAAERLRQQHVEGWTPEHDADHQAGELARAAACYAQAAVVVMHSPEPPVVAYLAANPPAAWPFHPSWWKPSGDPVRNLERAGALLAADIDRLAGR